MNGWEGWRQIRISREVPADPGVVSQRILTSRRLACGVALFVVATGALGVAQKVVGPEDFDRAMKTIDNAFDSARQSIASASYVDAKAPLALARQTLASTRPVWETNQEPDAVRMNREAVAALDALDEALSAIEVDAAAVAAAVNEVNRACETCHAKYREGDEQSGYRMKSASR